MAKEFKTFAQLIELLESRGVLIDATTVDCLRRESYYAIINGYKDPFLNKDAMTSSSDDVYKDGTSFRNIYDLFLFDRELRQLTFSYLARAEAVLKNAVVYSFCDKYRAPDAYLNRLNYVRSRDMLVPKAYRGNKKYLHAKNLAELLKTLNDKVSNEQHMRPFVRHYLNKYGAVPLWVLQNDLTFGNICHFYQLQNRGVQNAACKLVNQTANREERLEPIVLLRVIQVPVGFRNICAHDERLYCAEVRGAKFSDMYDLLSRVLPADEMRSLLNDLAGLVGAYQGLINQSVLYDVFHEMNIQVQRALGDS